MEPFAVIIPHRPDERNIFIPHIRNLMELQTVKPESMHIVSFKPENGLPDIVSRIIYGLKEIEKEGIDWVFIVENDDYYPPDYFEQMYRMGYDIIGTIGTWYFSIVQNRYSWLTNKLDDGNLYSSLFTTGFRISSFKNFPWDAYTHVNSIDRLLWEYAHNKGMRYLFRNLPKPPIGVKHGLGQCAGIAHSEKFPYMYSDGFEWIKANQLMRPESIRFYENIKNSLA